MVFRDSLMSVNISGSVGAYSVPLPLAVLHGPLRTGEGGERERGREGEGREERFELQELTK